MNKKLAGFPALVVLAAMPFLFCNKIIDWKNVSHHAPAACAVAEYHMPYYEGFNITFPVLFKKTYDASGKKLTGIDCSFWNVLSPFQVTHHELVLASAGSRVYLLDKFDLADTIVRVQLNNYGRPLSLATTGELAEFGQNLRSNNFFYTNNRLVAVETIFMNPQGTSTRALDSLRYDSYGNILSFGFNSYQYDYTRKAKQQFYIDDLMQFNNGYYLLQYLEYFPEVTSPDNVRTRVVTPVFQVNLTEHTFDTENRLTGYQFGNVGRSFIRYNCD